jgi:diguanylate cyclase (GGDEF)-like protein
VITFLTGQDLPLSAQSRNQERTLLSGTLAASMERLIRVAVQSASTPCGILTLLGADRRAFTHGALAQPWMAHDTGVLVRHGLVTRTVECGGALAVSDAEAEDVDGGLREALAGLGVRSMASATMTRTDGVVIGLLTIFDTKPRAWSKHDLDTVRDVAELATTELSLRHALAERELRERQLQHESLHDALTGLPNRTLFMKRLSEAALRARRGDNALYAVIFLDLDNFKLVNDSMGHHVGDEVLVTVARRLEECIRGGDLVARLGGDEFAILLERIEDVRDCALVAERVQAALNTPIHLGGYDHVSTASIGVVLSTSAREQPEYMLRSADMAMYRAKASGRARFEMFDRAMHAEALARLQLENDLRHAIERGEFVLHYQPLISLEGGHVVAVEALVRWTHPERGLVSPGEFVPVAEDTGLIVPLGRWVLREACRQAQTWRATIEGARDLGLSVNLSVREFAQPDLVRTVAAVLQDTGLPARALHLEITESAIIGQAHPALQTIAELKELGVAIHLDDFGTGYSALSYLHRLPLDAVKVDRAFTSAIDTEERPLHVVRSIIALVHAIGMRVVAEGVTTPKQVELLRSMGCDVGQGFYFSTPLPAAEVERLFDLARVGSRA